MKRKTTPAQVPASQLELPLGRQGAAHDLAWYIGLAKVFAAYHKRWPTADATREEFRAARIKDYDGQRIDRELRFPGPALEADPAYRALRERSLADGAPEGVSLASLDPRYRTVLHEEDLDALFDTLALPGEPGPGAVRYATGVPAHAPGELTLRPDEALRARALGRAGLDPLEPQVLARAFALRVQATDILKRFIERIGVPYPPGEARLADHYLLEAGDDGLLHIRYQLLSGSRLAGRFDAGRLEDRLAAVYGADPVLAALRAAPAPARDDSQAPALPSIPAPGTFDELRAQLATLAPQGQCLALPIQQLSRFDEIRRLLEKSGALFDPARQRFEFETGVDPALAVQRLINGGAAGPDA